MGNIGFSQIKKAIYPDAISDRIRRIWNQLAVGKETIEEPEDDGTSNVTTNEPEDEQLQELSSKLKQYRKGIDYFTSEISLYHYFSVSLSDGTDCEEENMKNFLKYLTELRDYLNTVPDYLHETKEYKDGVNLFSEGLDEYITELKNPYN